MFLKGKTAFITGCNRGIGRASVEVFAREGAEIWAHARTETPAFNEDMKNLSQKYHVQIKPLYFDIMDSNGIKAAVESIVATKTPIDILVNNAAIVGANALFHMTTIDRMKKVFDVNFFAMTEIVQYISRLMIRKRRGSIVNISSIAGLDGNPAQYEYAASKAAVIGATKKLAIDLGDYGIRVNSVAPGLTETTMKDNMSNQLLEETKSKIILNRLAKPEEIANVVAFLSSDLASYITGQIIRVDGGLK